MIREAGPEDRAGIEALLRARIDQAMFPLTNLRAHGLSPGGFPSPHEYALRIWRLGDSLIALTRAGMIQPLLDGRPDLSRLRAALAGQTIGGVTRAVLLALSEAAAQAYRALGIQPTQAFTRFLLSFPVVVAA